MGSTMIRAYHRTMIRSNSSSTMIRSNSSSSSSTLSIARGTIGESRVGAGSVSGAAVVWVVSGVVRRLPRWAAR